MPGPMGRRNKGPVEKAKDAKGTLKRLLKYFSQYKVAIFVIIAFSLLSTVFSILGPKILGKATTELFTGIIAKFIGTGTVDFGYIGKILFYSVFLFLMYGSK